MWKRIRIEAFAAGGWRLFLAFQDTFSHTRYPTPPVTTAIGSDHVGLYIFVILFYFPLPIRSVGLEFCNDADELRPIGGDGNGRTRSAITNHDRVVRCLVVSAQRSKCDKSRENCKCEMDIKTERKE